MRRFWIVFPLALAVIAFAAGCGQKEDAAKEQAKTEAESAAGKAVAQAQDAAEQVEGKMQEAAAAAQGELQTVEGTIGCAHCTFHVADACAPAIKTADGTIYVIDAASQGYDKAMGDRFAGKQATVEGTVEDVNGTMILHAAKLDIH